MHFWHTKFGASLVRDELCAVAFRGTHKRQGRLNIVWSVSVLWVLSEGEVGPSKDNSVRSFGFMTPAELVGGKGYYFCVLWSAKMTERRYSFFALNKWSGRMLYG